MANTKSAKKAIRQIARRTEINRDRRSRVRTFVRQVEEAIAKRDPEAARNALGKAEPELMRAAQKGVWHKNAAARTISRLSQRVKKINA